MHRYIYYYCKSHRSFLFVEWTDVTIVVSTVNAMDALKLY